MNINSSSKCWGYSRRPKNWRKYIVDDDYDIYELIAKNTPTKSRILTDEEIKELGLEPNKPEIKPEIKPVNKPQIKPVIKPKYKQIDSSTSYA